MLTVFSLPGVTLDHLISRLEARIRHIRDRITLMSRLLGREQRGVCGEGEVNTRERDQVGLELVQIDVEGTAEPERSCDRGHNLGNQPVQIGEAGLADIQAFLANVENSFVIHLQETCKSRT